MKNKIAVVVQGGLGDNIIYDARLQNLLDKEGVKSADFYLRRQMIWPDVLSMIIEFLEASPLIDYVYADQKPDSNLYKKVIDWTGDNSPMEFPIKPNYKAPYSPNNIKWALDILEGVKNPITFYPYTMGSNPHNEHEKYIRSPHEDWWRGLFEWVINTGGTPILLGGPNEKVDWKVDGIVEAYSEKDDFMNNIPLLYNIKGHVGIASWPWQLVHYYGMVDCCVIWTNNNFWIDRSVSEDDSKLYIFETVPEYQEIINKLSILKGK